MKTFSRFLCVVVVGACVQGSALPILTGNLLSDSGFESGSPIPSGQGGWQLLNGSSFSLDYARSGRWSLKSPSPGSPGVAPALQFVPATVGMNYELSAWVYLPTTLTFSDIAYVNLLFVDASLYPVPNGGAIVTFGNASPAGTWMQASVTGVAPAGTVYALANLALDYLGPESNGDVVYFDDVSLVQVPEPALTVFGTSAAAMFWAMQRRRS